MRFFTLLPLMFLSMVVNASTKVPMRIEENIFSSYYYADYDLPTGEPQRNGDWWGTVEYDLENEATSPDAGNGTFIALDDADDLSWEYYSDNTLPVHSHGGVNVVIKYYGCGTNMVQGIAATDLGISPVVAGDGGDNVKAIFYHKTLEKENAGDTYYNYTAIPNPFSRRPVRTDTDVMTGANCKFLGFYGWAAEYSDCSLAYADGTSFDGNAYADNIVLPGKKLKVTVTGENPTITFKALWDQCVVQTVVGTTVTTTGMVVASDAVGYATLYERQYNVCLNTTVFTAHSYPATYSQLYPDGTDGGYYNDTPQNITAVTPTGTSSVDNKFEYMNFTGTNLQKIVSTITNNTNYYARFVIGRGMNMATPVNFMGMAQNASKWNMRFSQGMDVRVESGNYNYIKAMTNTAGVASTANQRFSQSMYNVDGALSHFVLGSDFDRWQNNNSRLVSSGNVVLFDGIKFAEHSAKVQIDVLSGTFGTNSDNDFYMGMQSLNYEHIRYANSGSYPNLRMVSDRYITMLGGMINASFYGGHDENKENTGTAQPTVAIGGDGYAWTNANAVDVSSNYVVFKMKGGTLNGDFYGGDNVRFSEGGANRIEITAQPRRIAFVGGTVNGSVYGGSKFDDASSAATMTNNTHMSALALTDVDMYIGGNVALGSNMVYGGDNNTANSGVKTLHSVRNVNMVVSDGISVNEVYGGGNGAGLGKDYNWESTDPKGHVNIALKNASVTNVYGGMKGDSYTDMIIGSSEITINGGTYTNVYGGGNGTGSEIQGSTTVTLNSGTVSGSVYGGGNQGNVGEFTSDVAAVNINGGTVSGSVYGGGFQGYSYSSPAVNVKGGSVGGSVYGGANGGASYQDEVYTRGVRTVNVADNANVSGNVYGGSYNANDQVIGTESTLTGHATVYGQCPVWPSYKNFVQQFIILSDEMGGPKTISSIVFEPFYNKTSTTFNRTVTVYMQHTNKDYYTYQGDNNTSNASELVNVTGDTKRAAGAVITVDASTTLIEIPFDDGCDFAYDGVSNVVVTVIGNAGNENSSMTYNGSSSISGITGNKLVWKTVGTDYCRYMYMNGGSNCTTSFFDTNEFNAGNVGNAGAGTFGRSCVPVVGFTYSVSEENTKNNATAFVNVTKGSVGGSIYGSGNNNKMYGGCYVNIGKNAVENAPGHEANVNALETLTTGSIAISGSVYAGSNGTGSWAYTDANRSISGVSNVYLDGSGYSNAITIGGSKGTSAGNIYGCSTNGEGGKLGSNVFISNIGARNAEGKAMKSTTWGLNSVQHTDTLVLNNAHVTFNGAQQLEGSTVNSIYGIHKIMRVVNNSTALLKADADSIAKVGSYQCTDVYADSPTYTEVTAVESETSKTQLTDCKNTVVFANGSNLYMRSMESGTETYGELNGYLYAVNTDSENTANARARQKQTDNSDITGGVNYYTDGGFVSYDDTFNTYDNPPIDNYSAGVGGKQEIAFLNVSATPAYREWRIQASEEPNLWTEFVTERPSTFPTDEVIAAGGSSYVIPLTCENDLAWFISYVNGFNGCDAHPSAKAKLTADVNMNEYVWVPIGINNSTKLFSGSFDGQCYTIDGIHIANAEQIGYVEISPVGTSGDMQYTGMFGYTIGATIKNTFVTSGSLACDGENGYLGGLVGYANNTNIEFCESALALATAGSLSAVGGIAGQASGSTIKAVMAVGDITLDHNVTNAGGVTGVDGTVKTFYTNQTISGPGTVTTKNTAGTNGYCITSNTGYNMGTTGFSIPTSYTYGSYNSNNTLGDGTPLVDALNNGTPADGYKWMRSTSQAINGDYPIIVKVANADTAIVNATTDGKVVRYGDINELLGMEKYQNVAYSVFMYNSGELSVAPAGTKLYIDENVSMKQSTNNLITATVGITLDNSKGTAEMHRDWHMFSASIAAGKTGLEYISEPTTYPTSGNDLTFGTGYYLIQDDNSVYFPNGITTDEGCDGKEFDIYGFYEPQYHWMNLKRNTHHWHQDNQNPIEYTSEKTFTPGRGYLVAIGNNTNANNNLMQAEGVLNNGPISANVSNIGEHLTGYNLLGNPYQSYLDFEAFVGYGSNATNLWKAEAVGTKAFLIYDADRNGFIEYLSDEGGVSFSQNADEVTSQYIHPHQAFFVVKNTETQGTSEVRFDNTMRNLSSTEQFRGEAPAYPLVNLRCTDSDGKWEHSVIEFERPLAAGSLKMKELLSGKGTMYIHWADNDYRSVFIDYMPDYVPVWFETSENGVFTMTWNTANANFGYMHLIDNLTGTDYDCLAPGNDHYTFEAKTTDMAARFRLVFKPLGIEEETVENGENFAFFNGEQLIVNGSGDLQLIDVNGRILMTEHLSGEQNSISLPNVAAGMYMLRLNSDSEPKIQKIVVRK